MVKKFLDYMRYERNRSENTIKGYDEDLRAFESFFKNLDTHLSWESIDSDVIRDWMESMMDKGNTATTINRRLSALRSLYRFALSRHIIENDPARGITGPRCAKPLPQYLRESEMDRLIDDGQWGGDFNSTRARTIILLFYSTGMRLSELIGLNDADVDFASCQLKVTGKRNKQRIIPFGKELSQMLEKYIADRDENVVRQDAALLQDDKGRRMTPQQVRREVQKQLSKVSTLKKRSPHVLRHTFATAMLNNEAGLESVKKLLGHARLSTTEIYTHTTFEQLKREYNNAHPRA